MKKVMLVLVLCLVCLITLLSESNMLDEAKMPSDSDPNTLQTICNHKMLGIYIDSSGRVYQCAKCFSCGKLLYKDYEEYRTLGIRNVYSLFE